MGQVRAIGEIRSKVFSFVGFPLILLMVIPPLSRGQEQRPSLADLVEQYNKTRVFWQQFETAKAIVVEHDPSVLPRLETWLTSDDRHLRGNAAFVFAGLGDPRGFGIIVAILVDRSPRGKGQGGLVPSLVADSRAWSNEQIRADRYYAAHLLGDLKDPRGVSFLVPLLNDPEVSYIVPWSLGQIGGKSAISPLIGQLSNRNPDLRVLAIYALEQLRATEALPSLRAMLADNQRSTFAQPVSVAEAAKAAITKLEPTIKSGPSSGKRQ
jgi:HEAT repeat protein